MHSEPMSTWESEPTYRFIIHTISIEDAPIYWHFRRGEVPPHRFINFVGNYVDCWLKFYFLVQAVLGGLVVQIKLFYW